MWTAPLTIDHVGIAVENMDRVLDNYRALLQSTDIKIEDIPSQGVRAAMVYLPSGQKIELIAALDTDSPVHKFIARRGPGMHHLAYGVSDIRAEMERLRTAGYRVLQDEPVRGAGGRWVCFIHPKDTDGVLTELVELQSGYEEE